MTGNRKSWIKPAALTAVLLGAGGLGVAAAKSNDWGHGHCGERHRDHGPGKSWFKPGRHVEGKLAFLKAELKITGDQEEAWQAFAAVVRETDEARSEMWRSHRERRGGEDAERPALDERIARRVEAMAQRFEMFRDVAEAAKTLYAGLTPEQQAVADDLLPPGRGHGRHFRFR